MLRSWRPSTGATRTTALLTDVITPCDGERRLHGGASFLPTYVERVIDLALKHGTGIAFLHSHFTPGWQDMSPEDVAAERHLAPRIFAVTGLPLVGLTMGTDGALSARFGRESAAKNLSGNGARRYELLAMTSTSPLWNDWSRDRLSKKR